MTDKESIKIPFGAKDSELKGWEYIIPEGMEADIKDGKIIARQKDSEDERTRKELIGFLQDEIDSINRLVSGDYDDRDADDIAHQKWCEKALAYLEKQGEYNQNPYSGVSFVYNGHTWGMCARDNGVEILIDGQLKRRVLAEGTNTKEQRDLLLQKIKEAGYEWDAEKKELKNSEISSNLSKTKYSQSQSRSNEEDEAVINKAESWLDTLCDYLKDSSSECIQDIKDVINKLKFLKERYAWKPSDEQIEALEHFVRSVGESGYMSPYDRSTKIVYSLLDDLKKLKR